MVVHQVIITQERVVHFVAMPLTNVLTVLMGQFVINVWMGILWIHTQTDVNRVHCLDVWYANQQLLAVNVTVGFIWTWQHRHASDAHQQLRYKGVQYAVRRQFVWHVIMITGCQGVYVRIVRQCRIV